MWHLRNTIDDAEVVVSNADGPGTLRRLSVTAPGWWRLVAITVEPWPVESEQPSSGLAASPHSDLDRPLNAEEWTR